MPPNAASTIAVLTLMCAGLLGSAAHASGPQRALWATVPVAACGWVIRDYGWATGIFWSLMLVSLAGMLATGLRTWVPRADSAIGRSLLVVLGVALGLVAVP